MKALVRTRAAIILMVWLVTVAVQGDAAQKRSRQRASTGWDANWVVATIPISGSLPTGLTAHRARVLASPWTPNDGARVLDFQGDTLVPGTINSSWNNASGGNWSTATDWTPNGSPNNSGGNVYNVTLPTLTSNYTVTQDITSIINTLTIDSGATLTQNSGISLTTTSLTDSGTINLGNGGASTLTVNGATTISSGASLNVNSGSTADLNGTVSNSGTFATGFSGGNNTVTVTGAFTNNAGATLELEGSGDVMSVASLTNSGTLTIDPGATLNLTSQPNGITDVPAGSEITIDGSLKAGSANGLAKLGSIEGTLNLNNSQTNAVTPGGGTLTIASGGSLNLSDPSSSTTTLSITGAVSNSGQVTTGFSGGTNTITVSGAFTNNAGATLDLEGSNDTVSVASLSNSGTVDIGTGDTLNLTNQPNGITDVPQGSTLTIDGSLKAGSANGLAKLSTVEGTLNLNNGQTNAVTPGSGTLTIASGGYLNLSDPSASNTTLSITGAVTNSGQVTTGFSGGANTITVSGAFTNNAGADLFLEGSSDTVNVASLSNSGDVSIGAGDTLNLTNQPNGITDIPQGSTLTIDGSLKAGSANGLAKLGSVEGTLDLNNGQTNAVTPGGGTLTISSTGQVNLSDPIASTTTLSVTGNVTNSGTVSTGFSGGTNTVNVSGAFTNNAGAALDVESSTDVVSVATLSNSGAILIDPGASLKLTNQPNGITDIVAGSSINIEGNFTAGSASGISKLSTVAGILDLQNGQTTSVTPTGTFTVASTGQVNLSPSVGTTTTLAITGNVSNSGQITTGAQGGTNTITVSGSFTNGTGSILDISDGASTNDLVSVGTLTNSGTINLGTASGETGATLKIAGTSSNSGTINMGSTNNNQNTVGTLEINGSAVTLSGTGKIVMANLSGNVITATAATDVLTSANTIEGSGNIGNGNMGFVNTGTVEANQSTALIIDPSSKGFNNTGTLNVSAGDEMEITGPANSFLNYSSATKTLTNGTYLVSGTLQFGATGNTVTTDDAKITLTGSAAKIVDPSGGNIIAPLATIGTGGLFDITSGANFTTEGNFTNNGTLTVGSASKFVVKSGSSLTNFSGTTLTGGTYNVTGTLQFGASGTSLVTNAASITLTGAGAKIISSTNGNILTDFATNNAGALFDITGGYNFTTVGNFTNNGTLTIGSSTSKFDVNGNLTNFNSSTNTLTNGTYNVTGTLEFDNANIVTNDASLTLSGTGYKILNQTAGNGLANFATNNGNLTLASNAGLTSAGTITNTGTVKVNKGSTLTIGSSGNFTQNAGSVTVDGTLSTSGAGLVQINTGSVFGNGGNIIGTVTTGAGTTFNIGDAPLQAGKETITGTYTQGSAAALDIDIGGTTAGTNFDQLTITGAASLNGTLNLDLINNFIPTTSDTFEILTASSVAGTFSTVNGIDFNNNMDHFVVVYNSNNVTLDVASGPAGSGAWGGSGSGLLASNSQTAQVPGGTPSVPEPGSLLLLGSGLAGIAGYLRRRKK